MPHTELYWQPAWTTGLEHLTLDETADDIDADGLVLVHDEGRGLRLHYHVHCLPDWRVQGVEAQVEGDPPARCWLTTDGKGGWLDATGNLVERITGCIDVDIMATPFTNSLPIRRLNMNVGQSREIAVVYIKIPDLKVERAAQRYTFLAREGDNARYLYEGLDTDFKAELLVDSAGLVLGYQGLWQRAAP